MKLGLISLGCPKNLVDSEVMLGIIEKYNIEITNDPEAAEIIIVNTCGFIESAKQESIETILSMAAYKTEGCCRYLIVTGCLAQRYAQELFQDMPEVDAVVGTNVYKDIARVMERVMQGRRVLHLKEDDLPALEKSKPRRIIPVVHIVPKPDEVSPAERRRIEEALFDIFSKYERNIRTMEV